MMLLIVIHYWLVNFSMEESKAMKLMIAQSILGNPAKV